MREIFVHFQQRQFGPLRKLKIGINKQKVSDNNFQQHFLEIGISKPL